MYRSDNTPRFDLASGIDEETRLRGKEIHSRILRGFDDESQWLRECDGYAMSFRVGIGAVVSGLLLG
jgi:hypothetical protein